VIELVSASRCTRCDICVYVCPVNVFDPVPDAPPVIARQGDCQTCYMCELYCPADALYVSPDADDGAIIDDTAAPAEQVLGSYRRAIGWAPGTQVKRTTDRSYELLKPH